MILAIVGIVHQYDLLPYYLQHYRQLGVEKFFTVCEPEQLDPSGDLKAFLSAQKDIEVVGLPRAFKRSNLVGMIEEEIRQAVATASDWIIPSDLDELNQYPASLTEIIKNMEKDNQHHVLGEMKDRISSDGTLTKLIAFGHDIPIWQQYPMEGDVTKLITQGRVDKVLLSRGDLALGIGHHQLRDERPNQSYPQQGFAHHFKWQDGLEETLKWRIENEKKGRLPWCAESERLSQYLSTNNGKIIKADVNAKQGWRPDIAPVIN